MKWNYWICLYTRTHCTARGLQASTIAAYEKTLWQFQSYIVVRKGDIEPDEITAAQVLDYLVYLRRERNNGDSAVNRQVTVLKNFYRAIVAMGHLLPKQNPLAYFPKVKACPRKLPVVLTQNEVSRLCKHADGLISP